MPDGKAHPTEFPMDISHGTRLWLGGQDTQTRREMERLCTHAIRPATGPIDLAILTPRTADEAAYFARKLRPRLSASAMLWMILPVGGFHSSQEPSGPGPEAFGRALAGAGFPQIEKVPWGRHRIITRHAVRPAQGG